MEIQCVACIFTLSVEHKTSTHFLYLAGYSKIIIVYLFLCLVIIHIDIYFPNSTLGFQYMLKRKKKSGLLYQPLVNREKLVFETQVIKI